MAEDVRFSRKLKILHRNDRAVIVHHVDERGAWVTHDREILYGSGKGGEWEIRGEFPFAMPRDMFAWSRPTHRAMRVDKCNLYPTRMGKLLGIRAGTVYAIEGGRTHPLFSIQGDCVLHRGIAETHEGSLYFGEYFRNPERGPVRIWRLSPDLCTYHVAYTFPKGSARHVHGVYSDPYFKNRLWVTVGDYEKECFLVVTDDGFKTVERIGEGTQLWRAVGLLFTEKAICWLTDSHLEQNYVVSMDRDNFQLNTHGEVENSSWYCAQTSDGLFMAATTVEKGPGVKTDNASLLVSKDGIHWEKVASFRKDFLPLQPFGYGVISFPSGSFSSRLFWISGEGLVGLDGCSLLCSLDPLDKRAT